MPPPALGFYLYIFFYMPMPIYLPMPMSSQAICLYDCNHVPTKLDTSRLKQKITKPGQKITKPGQKITAIYKTMLTLINIKTYYTMLL